MFPVDDQEKEGGSKTNQTDELESFLQQQLLSSNHTLLKKDKEKDPGNVFSLGLGDCSSQKDPAQVKLGVIADKVKLQVLLLFCQSQQICDSSLNRVHVM